MLNEADACSEPGEKKALLRRQRERGTFYDSTQAGKELFALEEENKRPRKELHQSRSS